MVPRVTVIFFHSSILQFPPESYPSRDSRCSTSSTDGMAKGEVNLSKESTYFPVTSEEPSFPLFFSFLCTDKCDSRFTLMQNTWKVALRRVRHLKNSLYREIWIWIAFSRNILCPVIPVRAKGWASQLLSLNTGYCLIMSLSHISKLSIRLGLGHWIIIFIVECLFLKSRVGPEFQIYLDIAVTLLQFQRFSFSCSSHLNIRTKDTGEFVSKGQRFLRTPSPCILKPKIC